MEEGVSAREDEDSDRIDLEEADSGSIEDFGITTRLNFDEILLLAYFSINLGVG